jgi:large subunit ribosomal protein L7A
MLTDLTKGKKKVVGLKQTLKVIRNDMAVRVYLAEDVDQYIKDLIIEACEDNEVEIEIVESKLALGRTCGINVSAACAAILK